MLRRVVVVGGSGGLGRQLVKRFQQSKWAVLNVDLRENLEVENFVTLDAAEAAEHARVWSKVGKVDAVIHVAGGFEMGSLLDSPSVVEKMWEMNGTSAFTAAHIAAQILGENGLLTLTGAKAAFEGPTTFASGYGMAKAAVHHLAMDCNALFKENQAEGKKVVCILPGTIDTPSNREAMPHADFSTWTNPDGIAEKVFTWSNDTSKLPYDDIYVPV